MRKNIENQNNDSFHKESKILTWTDRMSEAEECGHFTDEDLFAVIDRKTGVLSERPEVQNKDMTYLELSSEAIELAGHFFQSLSQNQIPEAKYYFGEINRMETVLNE